MPSETVTGRFSTGRLARAVSPRLVLAVGARTELSIDRLDELGMAVDMVLAQASGQSVVVLTPEPQHLTVAVQPAADSWVERHRQLLASLVDRVEIVPGGVELRAG
ncbi:MAG: hypothetical protein ACTHNU_10660 [Gaiellales bacterium]